MNLRALLLVVLFAWSASAHSARAQSESYGKVVSAVSMYFDDRGDGDPDRAVLVADDGCSSFDLYLFVVDRVHGRDWSAPPTLVKKGVVEAGSHCGLATLKVGAKGALQIVLRNDWVPPRSSETLTIVYRDKEFLVAGDTTSVSNLTGPENADRPERFETCDVNFLTGKGLHDGKPFKLAVPPPKLERWGVDTGANNCGG